MNGIEIKLHIDQMKLNWRINQIMDRKQSPRPKILNENLNNEPYFF